MSNSGVNTGFAKCFILFMAVVILLQGCGYLGLAIWGLTLRECSNDITDITQKPFQFAMDIIYFLVESCGNPSETIPGSPNPIALNINWNDAEPVSNRTFIFMICYVVISSLWIITSLAVITTTCGRVTKTINAICFWPWFLVIIAGSILDAVATGYHIHDVFHTTSAAKTFQYLAITTTDQVMEYLSDFDAYFVTPSIVMTIISSRIVLVWFLNIFGSSFCLSLSSVLAKRNSSTQSSVNSLATTSTAPVTSPQLQITRQEIAQAQQDQAPQQQYIAAYQQQPLQQQEPSLIRPKPLQLQNVTSVQRQSSMTPQNNRPYDVQSPVAPVVANIYPSAPSPNESQGNSEPTTYRNTETHPDKLNYPSQQQQQQQPQSPLSPFQQELSVVSPLNNRYSTNNPAQNPRVSEELRGQLPWSYTSMPPPVPKKPQLQVYPEIPAPDYGN